MTMSRTPALLINAAIMTALTLSACSSTSTSTSPQPKTVLPTHNVVMMDPSIDDHSLPALGEGLSKGAVTIYTLDGPNAALPIDVTGNGGGGAPMTGAQPILAPQNMNMAPIAASPMSAPLTIQPPANMKRGNPDPRVSVFNPDTGVKAQDATSSKRPPATDPDLRPPLLPPPLSDKTQPLKSPFSESGALTPNIGKNAGTAARPAPVRDTTTWNPPAPPTAWTPPVAATGSDRRAVMSEDLMPPAGTATESSAKPTRPPKGMTY